MPAACFRRQGFTLIELLIVIVVIGIIGVLVIPHYQVLVIKARGVEAQRNLRVVIDSLWQYYSEYGDWPLPGPPYNANIPPDIDIKIINPSKNFTYYYYRRLLSTPDILTFSLEAYDNCYWENSPIGATIVYVADCYPVSHPVSLHDPRYILWLSKDWYIVYYSRVHQKEGIMPKDGW